MSGLDQGIVSISSQTCSSSKDTASKVYSIKTDRSIYKVC